jgi:hypothetical protein
VSLVEEEEGARGGGGGAAAAAIIQEKPLPFIVLHGKEVSSVSLSLPLSLCVALCVCVSSPSCTAEGMCDNSIVRWFFSVKTKEKWVGS